MFPRANISGFLPERLGRNEYATKGKGQILRSQQCGVRWMEEMKVLPSECQDSVARDLGRSARTDEGQGIRGRGAF